MRKTILAALLALTAAASLPAQQIRYAEPADIPAASGPVQFEAYGRRFALTLEDNERLTRGMPAIRKAQLGNIRLLRGALQGQPGSWVRLTENAGQVTGAIWDGSELYLVARYASVAQYLPNPLAARPDDTVVFRLSDTQDLLPPNFCATGGQPGIQSGEAPNNGLAQYKALVRELKLSFVAVPTDLLDVSLVADSALALRYAVNAPPQNDVRVAMLETLNVVDGIYDSQLGLQITASELHVVPAAADPFTMDGANAMLAALRTYRGQVPALSSKPISHLFTQRSLDGGSTLGIAHRGGACDATNGVSLTSVSSSGLSSTAALVMAHEIGHNLNAEHDTAECGTNYLMWPNYNGQTRFSQCSIDQMRPFISQHRGSCITSPSYADVETRIEAIADPLRAEPFTWAVYLRSTGNIDAADALVNIYLRGDDIDSATPTQGTCAPISGGTGCRLGAMAPGTEVRIDLVISPNYLGPLNLQAYANAANDRYDTNDNAARDVEVRPPATLTMSLSPGTVNAMVGDTVPFTYTITASGPRASRDIRLTTSGSAYLQVVSVTPSQGSCVGGNCTLGDLASGATATVIVGMRSLQGEPQTVSAQLQSSNAYLAQQNVYATLNATATFDLAIQVPALWTVAAGVPFDFVIPVRANGTRPVPGGLFRMSTGGGTVLSADVSGVPCAASDLNAPSGGGCPLGTLNPGDSRTVTVRMRFDQAPRDTNIYVAAEVLNDELWSNNSAWVLTQVRHLTDVSIRAPFTSTGEIEGREFAISATLSSLGIQDAADVTATLDVPDGLRVVSATLPQGTCTASGARRISCTRGTLPSGEQPQMSVRLIGDTPAMYTGTWTIAAANDGVPGNNSSRYDINILALADVAIERILPERMALIVDQSRDVTVEVFTGALRPVEDVRVSFPTSSNVVLESLTSPVGTCTVGVAPPTCLLGTLAPNTRVRITARYRAVQAGIGVAATVRVSASRDVDSQNNQAFMVWDAYEAGDVDVRVAAGSITGTVGANLVLPTITVSSGTRRAYDVFVDIPLPGFASVQTISGTGICSGAAPLTCSLGYKDPNTVNEISITLRLDGAGTFNSNVVVRAMNDTNAANNSVSFQIQSNAAAAVTPPPTTPTPPKKGGGGGRFDGAALALLALLALARARLPRAARLRYVA